MTADRQSDRAQRGARGRYSEWAAMLCLMANGYRILARQWLSVAGEIDLVAVRGRRLAFVEVKSRADLTDDEAHAAVGQGQIRRIHRAADLWLARHARYQDHDIGFDLILVAPGKWPRRIENAL
jgi:putative endonuclease